MDNLFAHQAKKDRRGQPLAERMRPQSLAEVVGQGHLLGEGRLLGRVMAGSELPSLLLWGPPGTGKTTLARLLANAANAEFAALSAVQAGVAQLREVLAQAEERLAMRNRKTVLFLDEIHRFNKSQQDALLPAVEAGFVRLIGATTENPSFEVNAALLSRMKVVRLESLDDSALVQLLRRALSDPERGVHGAATDDILRRIAQHAQGDARRALGTLEIAVGLSPELNDDAVTEALQGKALLYDKAGDEHYHVTSAFIKAMRASDPDAATYWLARMLEAGEDPLFILRRMVIFASEDIGNADPASLGIMNAAVQAFRFVGLPEGVLPLTQAVIHLCLAPKSNTALTTYAKAKEAVTRHGTLPVPLHVRNAPTDLARSMGHGAGYQYPHDFKDGVGVGESALPDRLKNQRFYEPPTRGREADLWARLQQRLRSDS